MLDICIYIYIHVSKNFGQRTTGVFVNLIDWLRRTAECKESICFTVSMFSNKKKSQLVGHLLLKIVYSMYYLCWDRPRKRVTKRKWSNNNRQFHCLSFSRSNSLTKQVKHRKEATDKSFDLRPKNNIMMPHAYHKRIIIKRIRKNP